MLTVFANTAIVRPSLRASSMAFKGGQFDIARSTNMFQSIETGVVFNKPKFLDSTYYSDFSGDNTRLGLSDFGVSTGWQETFINHASNKFLEKKSIASSEVLTYSSDITTETGFVITYHNYTSENEIENAITFDYWDDTEAINRIRCELTNNGQVTLIVNDDIVVTDSIATNKNSNSAGTKDEFIKVGIIPYFAGKGILLIFSTGKEIFYYDESFEDLADPLWLNTKFRIHVPVRASFSVTKLGYMSTGTLITEEYWFNEKPNLTYQTPTVEFSKVYGTVTTGTLVSNTLGAYTTQDTCRVKLETALSSGLPPFISAVFVDIPGLLTSSPANNTNVTSATQRLDFTFPEDNTQSSAEITLKGIDTLQTNYIYLATPFQVDYNGIRFVRGTVTELDYDYSVQYALNTNPVKLSLMNFWDTLEAYTFKDPLVLDGYNFNDAVKRILNEVGFPDTSCYLQTTTFDIPVNKFSVDEYQFKIDIGTTAKDALVQLFEAYAQNYVYQFRPIGVNKWFIAGDPDFVSGGAIKYNLYTKLENAKLDAGYSANHPGRLLVKNVRLTPMPLEANAIYINGQDPVTKNNIQVYKKDYTSIDHTLAIASRPKNWYGSEKPYGYQNKSITSTFLAERVCNHLFDKLTKITRLVEFDCYLQTYTSEDNSYIMYSWDRLNIDEIGDMTIISLNGNSSLHEQVPGISAKNGIKVAVVAKQQWDEENEIWTYLDFN